MSKSVRSVRIPDDLYTTIARMAEREERTASNMIIVLLKEALKQREQRPSAREERGDDKEVY